MKIKGKSSSSSSCSVDILHRQEGNSLTGKGSSVTWMPVLGHDHGLGLGHGLGSGYGLGSGSGSRYRFWSRSRSRSSPAGTRQVLSE